MEKDPVVIEVHDEQFMHYLEQLEKRLSNMTPFYAEVGKIIEASIKKNFDVEGRYKQIGSIEGGSLKWVPLDPVYAARKAKVHPGAKILQSTGQSLKSLGYTADASGVQVGFTSDVMVHHQYGAPKAHVPARPPLVIQEEDWQRIYKVAENFLKG